VRRRLLPVLAVALSLGALVACSDDDSSAPATTGAPSTTADVTDAPTTTAAPTSTTAAPDRASEVVLRGDGLGIVALGDPPDAAVAALADALGDPTADTGWEPSLSEYGTCPGRQVRGVEWDNLVLLFTDGDTAYGSGRHLFSWRITGAPPALGTAAGFGYGATAADAEELYPGAVEQVAADDPFPAFLRVTVEGGPITAYLDEQGAVTNLEAGAPCGE
jgi:hypothetical protein